MNKKNIMAVPKIYFCIVIAVCALGIIIGSFFDFDINVALANKTDIGAFLPHMDRIFHIAYILRQVCVFSRGL